MRYLLIILLFSSNLFATNYYVKNNGNDNADGLSDATAWKTIAKVNASFLKPGDNIYFKRGDMWREQLYVPASGTPGLKITFGAYGNGAKPVINGADLITGWTLTSPNIWQITSPSQPGYHGWGYSYVTVIDDSLCSEFNSLGSLTSNYQCYYDRPNQHKQGNIYIYSTTNPNTRKVEVSKRTFGVYLDGKINIIVKNLDIRYAGLEGIRCYGSTNSRISGNTIIDSCYFYGNRESGVLLDAGYSDNIIQNSTAIRNGNGFYAASYTAYGSNNNLFTRLLTEYNIHHVNDLVTDGHGIGIYNSDSTIVEHCTSNGNFGNIMFAGNYGNNGIIIRYNLVENSQGGNTGIGCGSESNRNIYIYYNLLLYNGIAGLDGYGMSLMKAGGTGHVYVYNNSLITNTTSQRLLYIDNTIDSTIYFKNNLLYQPSKDEFHQILYLDSFTGTKLNFDYNMYYKPNPEYFYTGNYGNINFAPWQAYINADSHSTLQDPLFTNPSNDDYSLRSGSPAINAGTNVGLTQDYFGNPIIGKPDIGAIQHPFITANIKIYLEGSYKNGYMTTNLNTLNYIPKKQPYNITPFNYSGTESVSSIPQNIVDWVLVEIRGGVYSNTTIARRAAFLKNDGRVVDLDGNSPLRFDFLPEGAYYIVIRHRNHLSVMSSLPVIMTDSTALYDFSTAQAKAYGINPMFNLGNNVYGMYAGDGDANGGISSIDRNNIWFPEKGKTGYQKGDFNLDGIVNDTDLNFFWSISNGNLSQVPK